MDHPPAILDQVAERVERLLARHAELRSANRALAEQVDSLTRQRDALRARLHEARQRMDAVLERLPPDDDGDGDGSDHRDGDVRPGARG